MSHKVHKALRELIRINAVQVAERQLEERQQASEEQSNGWEAREERKRIGMLAIGSRNEWHPNAVSIGCQIVRQTGKTLDKDVALASVGAPQIVFAQTHGTRFGDHNEILIRTQRQAVGKE